VLGLALVAPAVTAATALAAPSTVKLEVNENCVEPNWPCWATPGSNQPALKVAIASGGAVAFVDEKTAANIAWTGGAAPTCEASVPVAPAASKTGWEGQCIFATPGAYKFESSTLFDDGYNNYTKYEVMVEGSATTPSAGTPGAGGANGGPAPGATTQGPAPTGESPIGSALFTAPSIRASQQGTTVKGSLPISKAGAGDRLEVDLLATAAALAKTGHTTQVVGRFIRASVSAGRQPFSVKLDAKAIKALKRRHRLALKVKIALTPIHGEATIVTRSIAVHI
jgi:hypothetical protein